MTRRLSLRREALAELGTADLTAVRGAAEGTHVTCYTGLTYCVCNQLVNDTFGCGPIPTIHHAAAPGAAC